MHTTKTKIDLENASVVLLEGKEVARTYTEVSENGENISVALYLRYVCEDVGSDVLIDVEGAVEEPYFRLYVDKCLVFEQTSTISVYDGDLVIEDKVLFFRHFARNGLSFKLDVYNEFWSLSVERSTIEQPRLLEQALAEWAVN